VNGYAIGSGQKADSQSNGDSIKLEEADHASVNNDESEQNGRGRKRRQRGKDNKVEQPIRSYPTRERAKAEAEVEAEVKQKLYRKLKCVTRSVASAVPLHHLLCVLSLSETPATHASC